MDNNYTYLTHIAVPKPTMLDRRGAIRSPITLPEYGVGKAPVSKGRVYAAHPFDIEDLVKFLNACHTGRKGPTADLACMRLQALIIVLWRTGLRISEALNLEPRDIDEVHQTITVRRGKGGKRRVVKMDRWGWDQFRPWLKARENLPFGAIFCVITGNSKGWPMLQNDVRRQFREAGGRAKLRRRVNPHALRHTHAVDLKREGMDFQAIQTQLGHARLDVTAAYLRGIDVDEVLQPIADRRAPVMPITI